MGVTVQHVFTSPIADGTNTQLVRPTNWNETHLVQVDGFAGTGFSGTNISGTVNTNGISLSVAAGGGGADGYNILAAGTQTAGTAATVNFANGNGITFGMSNSSQITASHNGLTTARASNDAIGLNTALTGNGVAWTVNSNGLSLNVPAFLTTARASNDGVGLNTALTAGPLAWTVNSGGISLNAGSAAGTTSGFGGNSISGSITHNTAGINISLNHPSWLTTAANSTHSHGNPTLALTNINGTTASASNGLTLSLSAIVPAQSAMGFSGSNGSFTASTLSFGALNGLTFYTSNGSIVGSYTDAGAGGGVNFSAGTTSSNLAAVTFANSNGVSFGLGTGASAGVITASAAAGGGGYTKTFWYPYNEAVNVAGLHGQASLVINPVPLDDALSAGSLVFPMYFSNASNSSGTLGFSLYWGAYTKTDNSLSLVTSISTLVTMAYVSNNSSASQRGVRLLAIPMSLSLEQSRYYVGMAIRSSTTGNNCTLSQLLVSQLNSNVSGMWDSANANSVQWPLGVGYYSASTLGIPGSIAFSQIYGTNSLAARPPSWHAIEASF